MDGSRLAVRCAALALSALASCGGGSEAPPAVVWIEIDTLRADALGCYGNGVRGEGDAEPSPHIDALAAEGTRFERAYSVAPWTVPSVVSQLTGLWPWEHGAVRVMQPVATRAETVAERFRRAGWRTAGVMTNFIVREELGFARGFERWDESHATGHKGSTGSAAVAQLLAFADELRADGVRDGAGLLLFALLFEPHYEYEDEPGPSFAGAFGDGAPYDGPLTGGEPLPELRRMRADLGPADVAFLRGRYQSEVSRVDRAVGELVRGLRARGLHERATIVVTADHGEEIMDRGWIGHTRTLHDELVRVPLVVRSPGKAGRVASEAVSLVDLPATLLELAGLDASGFGSSRSFASLVAAPGAAPRRFLYLHSDFEPPIANADTIEKVTHLWGVVDGERELKWIVDRRGDEPAGQLFDLAADPGERRDLSAERETPRELLSLDALDPSSSTATGRAIVEGADS